jgi:hypothetical protein
VCLSLSKVSIPVNYTSEATMYMYCTNYFDF